MKSTEPTWFKKYRDDYLQVFNILANSRAEELVSKMEWFGDNASSKYENNSSDLLKSVCFKDRYLSTETDKRRTKLFFYKIKNSRHPKPLFSLALLLNLFLRDCARDKFLTDYNGLHFFNKIKEDNFLNKNYNLLNLLNKVYLFIDLLSSEEKIYILQFILGDCDSDVEYLILKFKNMLRFAFKKSNFNNWFLDVSLKLFYDKDGNCDYLKTSNLIMFFDLNKNCLRAANNKSYFLNENLDNCNSSDEVIVSYFIAKPGQIKVFKDIDILTTERFNSRKSLDFFGEIFEEYLKRSFIEESCGSSYFLKDIFSKYPDIFMEIILKDSADIFKNNLNKFINSETCKISLLRHGGNLPVYVDLKEDDHTKYRYL